MVFNDNDDIFNNTDCDHIDRYWWYNKPENIRWVSSKENMNNRGVSTAKIDRKHDKSGITYLEKWMDHLKIKLENIKCKNTKNDKVEQEKQKKIVKMNGYLESLNNDR
jgi:hypothetical protein